MPISFRDVAEILKAIDESQADHIEIEIEGMRLAVRKRGSVAPSAPVSITDSNAQSPESGQSQSASQASASAAPAASPSSNMVAPEGHEIIRSPMVGTFYSRPSPAESPFVESGSSVKPGDPLCLIEVMKLYTTIEAANHGAIISIFAEDGQLVEFDQQLFLIKLD